MNELVKINEVAKMNGGEVVVQDPFNPEKYHAASDVNSLISSANARCAVRRKQLDDLGNIEEAPLDAVKELYRALKKDDDTLKDFDNGVKDALLKLSGFKAYVTQTKGNGARIDPLSVRGKFAAMMAKLKAVLDAAKPPAPTHTYVIRLTCTDETLMKVCKSAEKAGATEVLATAAQSDKAVEQIEKWFDENCID